MYLTRADLVPVALGVPPQWDDKKSLGYSKLRRGRSGGDFSFHVHASQLWSSSLYSTSAFLLFFFQPTFVPQSSLHRMGARVLMRELAESLGGKEASDWGLRWRLNSADSSGHKELETPPGTQSHHTQGCYEEKLWDITSGGRREGAQVGGSTQQDGEARCMSLAEDSPLLHGFWVTVVLLEHHL